MRRSQGRRRPTEKLSRRQLPGLETVKSYAVEFDGGLNETAKLLGFPEGDALTAINYIPCESGYELSNQIERFDGAPRPSEDEIYVVPYTKNIYGGGVYFGVETTGATSGAEIAVLPLFAYRFKNGTDPIIPGTVIQIESELYFGGAYYDSAITITADAIIVTSGSWNGGDAAGFILTEGYINGFSSERILDGATISGYGTSTPGAAQFHHDSDNPGQYVLPYINSNCQDDTDIATNERFNGNVYKIAFENGTSGVNPVDGNDSYPEWFRPPCCIKTNDGYYFWLTEVEITSGDPDNDDAAGWLYGYPLGAAITGTFGASSTYFFGGNENYMCGGSPSGGYAEIAGTPTLVSTGLYTSREDALNDGVWKNKGTFVGRAWNGTAYVADEELQDDFSTTFAYAQSDVSDQGTSTGIDSLDKSYSVVGGNFAREYIRYVPGRGPIGGLFEYDGDIFALRVEQAGDGDAIRVYKATGTIFNGWGSTPQPTDSWTEVEFYRSIFYDSGTQEFVAGDTVTGGTSGTSADVIYAGVIKGTTGGDLTGWLLIDTPTGGTGAFNAGEDLNISGIKKAEVTAAIATNPEVLADAIPKCDVDRYSFGTAEDKPSDPNLVKVYLATGVSHLLFYDGTKMGIIPMDAGIPYPKFVRAHKGHLFVGCGSDVIHSGIGTDTNTADMDWSTGAGAGAINIQDDCTGMATSAGGTLALFSRDKISVLYGTSAADWELKVQPDRAGAVAYSLQPVTDPVFFDVQGITTLKAVQEFGDFRATDFSEPIERTLAGKSDNVECSVYIKDRDQYWLFFDDGSGVAGYMKGKRPKWATINYNNPYHTTPSIDSNYADEDADYEDILRPHVALATEFIDGVERVFIGDKNGFVYELNSGTSMDGVPHQGYLRLAPLHLKSPQQNKKFIKATMHVEAPAGSEVRVTYEMDYGDWTLERGASTTNTIENLNSIYNVDPEAGYWGIEEWTDFPWGGKGVSEINVHMAAVGRNIGFIVSSESAVEPSHIVQSMVLEYMMRGRKS